MSEPRSGTPARGCTHVSRAGVVKSFVVTFLSADRSTRALPRLGSVWSDIALALLTLQYSFCAAVQRLLLHL